MHSKSDNIEILISDKEDEAIKNFLIHLEIDIKIIYSRQEAVILSSIFDHKCHEINFNRRVSYIDSPYWIKNKKVTINPINEKDNKCF